jgi:hypothetical protein
LGRRVERLVALFRDGDASATGSYWSASSGTRTVIRARWLTYATHAP